MKVATIAFYRNWTTRDKTTISSKENFELLRDSIDDELTLNIIRNNQDIDLFAFTNCATLDKNLLNLIKNELKPNQTVLIELGLGLFNNIDSNFGYDIITKYNISINPILEQFSSSENASSKLIMNFLDSLQTERLIQINNKKIGFIICGEIYSYKGGRPRYEELNYNIFDSIHVLINLGFSPYKRIHTVKDNNSSLSQKCKIAIFSTNYTNSVQKENISLAYKNGEIFNPSQENNQIYNDKYQIKIYQIN